jgi:hypothetical protein
MEYNLSRETNSRSASQEIPRLLWNPKIQYCFHKDLTVFPTVNQTNPVYIIIGVFRSVIIIPSVPKSST